MFNFAFVALLALAIPSPAVDVDDARPAARTSPRVRPYDARSANVLLQGIQRSETIRSLVDRLEQLDVIVYIQMQPALRTQLAGRMVWVTATGHLRYVRLSLNPELSGDTLVSVLGHELQHAVEVAQAPSIVSEATLEEYYQEHGISVRSHSRGWDTLAARDAGELVRREISTRPASRATESVQGLDPNSWHSSTDARATSSAATEAGGPARLTIRVRSPARGMLAG